MKELSNMSTLSVKFSNLRRRLTPERDMPHANSKANQSSDTSQPDSSQGKLSDRTKSPDTLSSQKAQNDLEFQEYLSRRFDAHQQAKSQQQFKAASASHLLHYHHPDFASAFAAPQPPIPAALAPHHYPPSAYASYHPASLSTSSQFDRLASGVAHLSLPHYFHHDVSAPAAYHPRHAPLLNHPLYSSSSASSGAELRDNEIERFALFNVFSTLPV